ncbi:hypothetical protein, partial [Bacillus mycoides]|uniref:hypothetical protein n=1 Tax=Bacillus mycoides TaxID=1405 RepID=UPI001F3BAF5C
RVLARRVGTKPHVLRIYFVNKNYFGMNDQSGSAIYLHIQVDRHCIAFCLSAWRKKHTSRKKFRKDTIKKEKAIAFR